MTVAPNSVLKYPRARTRRALTEGNASMIEFRDVTKTYPDGTHAVRDFSLVIPARQITVLVGSSGSGKTTLMRMINRMVDPTSGTVEIDGQDISKIEPVKLRRGIGYVMQNSGLLPHRTVAENIATVSRLTGVPKAAARKRALELMDTVGLTRSLADAIAADAFQRDPHGDPVILHHAMSAANSLLTEYFPSSSR